LELVLACDFRLASDSKKTLIGLPEVNLGIIPGFGGTQRLPRLVGLQVGLELILAGKTLKGAQAHRKGVVDKCVPQAFINDEAEKFVSAMLSTGGVDALKRKRKKRGAMDRFWPGTSLVCWVAKKQLIKKTQGHYPAPLAALKVIRKTYQGNITKGLKVEAKAFSELVPTTISKNLVQLFYTHESLKKYTGVSSDIAVPSQVRQASVVGAGLMGGGIAWALSNKGIAVRLKDIQWGAIAKGLESAAEVFYKGVKRRKLSRVEAGLKLGLISGATDFSGFQSSNIVIEAIPENMGLKKKIFQEMESNCPEATIIASNTSALSISEMASDLRHPDRFIGMHFFSPVHRMPLVEVIPGEKTSPETIAATVQLAKRMGKTPIVIQNCPGFLINRILLPYVSEAVYLLGDGATIQTIDSIAVKFGMPLGPLALADEVGLDVGIKVTQILEQGYGDRMKSPPLFKKVVEDKELLGKKTNEGFYRYMDKHKVPSEKMMRLIKSESPNNSSYKPTTDVIRDRLILIMVNEAARCLEEGIVEKAEYLDMAMIMGTGFPPFRGGLLRYADQQGISGIVERLQQLADITSNRFKPASILIEMARLNQTFYK